MFTIGLLELLFVLSGGLLIWLLVHVLRCELVGCTADLLALIFASSSGWLVVLLEILFLLVLKLVLYTQV